MEPQGSDRSAEYGQFPDDESGLPVSRSQSPDVEKDAAATVWLCRVIGAMGVLYTVFVVSIAVVAGNAPSTPSTEPGSGPEIPSLPSFFPGCNRTTWPPSATPPGLSPAPALPSDLALVLWVSDLHWETQYSPTTGPTPCYCRSTGTGCSTVTASPVGQFGCDAPHALLVAAFDAMRRFAPDPDAIVVTGDFARHATSALANPEESVRFMIANATAELRVRFPQATLAGSFGLSLGNDDFVPNYGANLTVPNPHLTAVAAGWAGTLTGGQRDALASRGYYAAPLLPSLVLLALHTVVYSRKHAPAPAAESDPLGQFAWLEEQLTGARRAGHLVILSGHIPPIAAEIGNTDLWQRPYVDRFWSIAHAHADVIAGQLFGHIHRDAVVVPDGALPPLLTAASVSPVYNNNPAFRALVVNRTSLRIVEAATFFAPLDAPSDAPNARPRAAPIGAFDTSHGEVHAATDTTPVSRAPRRDIGAQQRADFSCAYSTRGMLGLPAVDAAASADLRRRLSRDNQLATSVATLAHLRLSPQPCDAQCARQTSCIMRFAAADDVSACITDDAE